MAPGVSVWRHETAPRKGEQSRVWQSVWHIETDVLNVETGPHILTVLAHYLPGSILLYVLLFFAIRFLLRRIPKEPWRPPAPTARFSSGSLIAIGTYALLTILYFAPFLTRLGSMLIGPPEDNMQAYWNMWYGWEVFRGHYPSLFYCNILAYPKGASMLYHSYSYYNLALSLVLRPLVGPVLTYNLLLMHTFVIGGLGGFFLGRYLLRDDYLALVVGFVFAFNPFHFVRILHHINIASLQFVPFFVLFILKRFASGNSRTYSSPPFSSRSIPCAVGSTSSLAGISSPFPICTSYCDAAAFFCGTSSADRQSSSD